MDLTSPFYLSQVKQSESRERLVLFHFQDELVLCPAGIDPTIESYLELPVAKKPLITAGIYLHFKGGSYAVIGVARLLTTGEYFVIYFSFSDHTIPWVRPVEIFDQLVPDPHEEGKEVARFRPIFECSSRC